ncbi:MAG: type II toxin-antitoxin system RelE/ParE family toxin [Rhodospirillaceae bacterium]|nr:type II toxin-antitoxin system RelE/ParE family toxin [Rhodospirillaceae bacterium]
MRRVVWLKAALKRFEKEFPDGVKADVLNALAQLAAGLWPGDLAVRWMTEIGPSAAQITADDRGDTFRTVVVVKGPDDSLWVIGAFKKKSKSGRATPGAELDTLKERYKLLMRNMT